MPQKIGHSDLIYRADIAFALLQKNFIRKLCSQDIVAIRLFGQLQRELERLKRHICQNMSDDLAKHIEAHRVHLKKCFSKESFVFSRSIS